MTQYQNQETGTRTGRLTRRITVLLTAVFAMLLLAVPASAAPKIKQVSCNAHGKIEIHFTTKDVQYMNTTVSIKTSAGKHVGSYIIEGDSDELEIGLDKYKQGTTYLITVKGIRRRGESRYGTVKTKIRVPKQKGKVHVYKIEYDAEDREVTFKFDSRIFVKKNFKVKITRAGKSYAKNWHKEDYREVEVNVKKLKPGRIYRYKITGIKNKKTGTYTTISGNFTA